MKTSYNTQYSKKRQSIDLKRFNPFKLNFSLIGSRSQSASCHIAIVRANARKNPQRHKLTYAETNFD